MKIRRYFTAGGVVIKDNQVLILRRNGHNDVRLPKGEIEPGETPQAAAMREVTEESGYTDLEVIADLGHDVTPLPYPHEIVLRDERYFLMLLHSDRQVTRPSQDHIFTPLWRSWDHALSELTFEEERRWVQAARQRIRQQ